MSKRGGKTIRPIRATISTIKLHKILNKVHFDYKDNELMRDAYLAGIRDIIGQDDGWAFRRAVLANDRRDAARFCSDGWKVIGNFEAFNTSVDSRWLIDKLRNLIHEAIKEGK